MAAKAMVHLMTTVKDILIIQYFRFVKFVVDFPMLKLCHIFNSMLNSAFTSVMDCPICLYFGKIPKFGKMTILFRAPNPTDVEKLEKSAPFCVDA
jgi:hypothetical protein